MAYVDGFVLAVPKNKLAAIVERREPPANYGGSTERSSIASVPATTSRSLSACSSRSWRRRSLARRSSSRGSFTNPVRRGIVSTPR